MSVVARGDVIQLDVSCDWGPLLCIVDVVHTWGVVCYALVPELRGHPPGQMYYRAKHADYTRIGKATWVAGTGADNEQDSDH